MNKKNASIIWIATRHFIEAGICFPFLFAVLFWGIFLPLPNLIGQIIAVLIPIVAIWLGTIYSSKLIIKKYIIKESDKIVNWSVIYYIFFTVLVTGSNLLKASEFTNLDTVITISLIGGLVGFYPLSKKYIKNNQ